MEKIGKRARVRDSSAIENKHAELLAKTQDFSDGETESWIKTNFKPQARSLAFTGRKQTLWLLASLLVDS